MDIPYEKLRGGSYTSYICPSHPHISHGLSYTLLGTVVPCLVPKSTFYADLQYASWSAMPSA